MSWHQFVIGWRPLSSPCDHLKRFYDYTQCLDNANEDYHNGATVREVCLDAEDIVVPNLNTSTVRIIQVQIPNLNENQRKMA